MAYAIECAFKLGVCVTEVAGSDVVYVASAHCARLCHTYKEAPCP